MKFVGAAAILLLEKMPGGGGGIGLNGIGTEEKLLVLAFVGE